MPPSRVEQQSRAEVFRSWMTQAVGVRFASSPPRSATWPAISSAIRQPGLPERQYLVIASPASSARVAISGLGQQGVTARSRSPAKNFVIGGELLGDSRRCPWQADRHGPANRWMHSTAQAGGGARIVVPRRVAAARRGTGWGASVCRPRRGNSAWPVKGGRAGCRRGEEAVQGPVDRVGPRAQELLQSEAAPGFGPDGLGWRFMNAGHGACFRRCHFPDQALSCFLYCFPTPTR